MRVATVFVFSTLLLYAHAFLWSRQIHTRPPQQALWRTDHAESRRSNEGEGESRNDDVDDYADVSRTQQFASHPKRVRRAEEVSRNDGIVIKTLKAFTSLDWETASKSIHQNTDLALKTVECSVNPRRIAEVGLRIAGWKDATIPYTVDSAFNESERATIANAILIFHENTCVRFVERKSEKDFIQIRKDESSCSSLVGKGEGYQDLLLSPDCAQSSGIVQHELMHALGFIHEHQRPDRVANVAIMWPNVNPAALSDFMTYPAYIPILSYDYNSIMHYKSTTGSWNELPTLVPLKGSPKIGQRDGLSEMDIMKVNMMYCDENGNSRNDPVIVSLDQAKTTKDALSNVLDSVFQPLKDIVNLVRTKLRFP